MFRKKQDKPKKEKLPRGIEKVERGYRVKGLKSIHLTVEKALRQLEGWKNAN